MNFKTTLILLIALILVGGYIIVDRYVGRDKEPTETSDTKKLFDIKKAEDVTSVTIKPAEGSEVVLAKVNDKWRMTKPVDAAAEAFEVDSLVRDLVNLESTAQMDVAKAPGLDKPRYNIELSAKGGKSIRFKIGDK